MKFKLFDSILDRQDLFVDHVVILFRVFELSACMRTEVTYTIYLFKKDGTPVITTGIRATHPTQRWYHLKFPIILFDLLEEDYTNMATTSSSISTPSSSSSHISLSSTLSLPKSFSKHITSKIENLVEYSYIPESAQINES